MSVPYDPEVRDAATSALTLRIRDLPLRPIVACDPAASIAEVAARMSAADTASAVALDEGGRPVGIVTDSDLRRRVVTDRRDAADLVRTILSAPVVTIHRDALGLEAVQEMLERHIHHLAVVDDAGRAVGVLADSDLLAQEATDPLMLARRIERASSVDELAAAHAAYPTTIALLLRAGAPASAIGRIVAQANDRLQRRLLALAAHDLGPAPARFAWVVMGSEARRMQTLRTDQDNGLVWDDDAPPDAHLAFARLGEWMVEALARCGVPRCGGDVMASSKLWRGPAHVWRERFEAWMREPVPVALVRALIAFDLRAAGGAREMVDDLRVWLMARTPAAHVLIAHLARELGRRRVPLGAFGGFQLTGGGFDAKMAAVGIAVDGARLLALRLGITEPSTLGRLDRAVAAGAIPAGDGAEVREAYEAIQSFRFARQVRSVFAGRPPDNVIVPGELSRAERAALKEHLHALRRFQQGVLETAGPAAPGA